MQPTNVAILYLGEQNVSLYDGVAWPSPAEIISMPSILVWTYEWSYMFPISLFSFPNYPYCFSILGVS
jgi:hypothetical protein